MHTQDRACTLADRRFYLGRIDIERIWVDIDKHGDRAAISNAVGGRDKRMAYRDDSIARFHARHEEGQV
jgi:hypothetical protein